MNFIHVMTLNRLNRIYRVRRLEGGAAIARLHSTRSAASSRFLELEKSLGFTPVDRALCTNKRAVWSI
jgi:hypothetical protein